MRANPRCRPRWPKRPDQPNRRSRSEAKLELEVAITDAGPCKKHLKITIPRSEIDLQYEESLESLRKDAAVPGFRPGRAPRQLIVKRFRKQVSQQVKSNLLMSSLDQIDKEYKLEPIVQPRLDIDAIEIPETGPMSFEMDVEVRPQFDLPHYKGLKVKRPVAELTEKDIDDQLNRFLEGRGTIVPKLEGNAEIGDYITADLTFIGPDGRAARRAQRSSSSAFSPSFASRTARSGASVPPSRGPRGRNPRSRSQAWLGRRRPRAARGHDSREGPDQRFEDGCAFLSWTSEFFDSMGFDDLAELRERRLREMLKRKIHSEQRQAMHRQIVDQLIRQTPFDLPTDLVDARREDHNPAAGRAAQAGRHVRQGDQGQRSPDPRQRPRNDPALAQRVVAARPDRRRREDRSRASKTPLSKSKRSPRAPTRAFAACALASRRKEGPTRS